MDIEVPGYDIKHEIGHGGMATVYLARQISFGRDVALKIMSPLLAGDEGFTKRFLKEASTVAKLMHPNIIKVFDTGVHNDLYYLAMEYFPAGTLKQHIDDGLDPATSTRIIRAVLEALRYAHGQGLIHRDIKSQNILLYEDNTPVVSDFGIVKIVGEKTMLTITGLSVGSPLYMSPEQIKGAHTVDERSDLYSVGILFYEMLTGRVPFDAEETFAVAFKHIYDPIPVLPADLAAFQPFIAGLLAKEPANRFANAATALKMLDQCLASKPPAPVADSTVVLSPDKAVTQIRPGARPGTARIRPQPAHSGRKRTGIILTLTLLIGAGAGFYVWQQYQASLEQQRLAELEQQRQAELEQQRLAELEQQRQAELEQQRLAELEQQRQAELEQQRQAELEQQRQAELEQQRQAELEQQFIQLLDGARQAQQSGNLARSLEQIAIGLALKPDSPELLSLLQQVQQQLTAKRQEEQQRQAELEQQRQAELEQQRQAELEQQRLAELEQQRQAELERQRQAELEQQRQAELEQQRQAAQNQPEQLLAAARQAFAAGDFTASLQQLATALQQQPDNTEAQQLQLTVQAALTESELGLSRSKRQAVQQALTELGFDTRGVDGILGSNSRRAIRAFQDQRGLPATGYINAAQLELLQTAAAALAEQTARSIADAPESDQVELPDISLVSPERPQEPVPAEPVPAGSIAPDISTPSPTTEPTASVASPASGSATTWQQLENRLAPTLRAAEQFLRQAQSHIRSAPPSPPAAGPASSCDGDCSNGSGTYYFNGGDIYIGDWRDEEQDGQGIYFHRDGAVYEGSFRDGQRSGLGTFYYTGGDIYYGSWQRGVRNGKGLYRYANGITLYGHYSNGRLSADTVAVFYNNGDKYIGQWKGDKKHGKGIYYENNGTRYAGEWNNNVKTKVIILN